MHTDSESLARAWISLQENWWAHDALDDAAVSDPEVAWLAICRVLEGSGNPDVLEVTAAGPLESLLRAHGAAFIDRVEAAARSHESWRKALRIARIPSSDDSVAQRLFGLGCARVVTVSELPEGFVGDVREYIGMLDTSESVGALQLLARSAELLARIYSAGLLIGPARVTDDDVRKSRPSPLAHLSSQLGEFDFYWCVFNARMQEEPVVGSLADDLADIYLELAGPLDEFDAGRHDNAIWGWRLAIRGHAGDHLVRALPVIHAILQEQSAWLTTSGPTPA